MSDQEFKPKVGDVVELISGGPPMTVVSVNTNMLGEIEIVCRWWCGALEKATFGPKHLKPGRALSFFELRSFGGGPLVQSTDAPPEKNAE